MKYLKIALGAVATLTVLAGVIWIFQGLNILPGSFMTGDMQWTWRGAGVAVVGAAVLAWVVRTPGVIKGIACVIGVLMVLMGVVWILQGFNILPGSFMTGDIQWAWRGAILAVVGLVLLLVSLHKPRAKS